MTTLHNKRYICNINVREMTTSHNTRYICNINVRENGNHIQ